MSTTYAVKAYPAGSAWHLEVPQVERVTQARHAREIEAMAKDLIEIMTGEEDPAIEVEFVLPTSIQRHIAAAKDAKANAEREQERASGRAGSPARRWRGPA